MFASLSLPLEKSTWCVTVCFRTQVQIRTGWLVKVCVCVWGGVIDGVEDESCGGWLADGRRWLRAEGVLRLAGGRGGRGHRRSKSQYKHWENNTGGVVRSDWKWLETRVLLYMSLIEDRCG